MNDRDYMGDKVNPRWVNILVIAVLVIAFVVAVVSLPLFYYSGG
jgi:Mn2+/Fe2+ NRAMP family transporter